MAAAGAIQARCLKMLRRKCRPGVTTAELDEAAEKFIRSQGASPSFKGYRGFPGSICASPNSMVVHGIPGPYELQARRHASRSTSASPTTAGSPTPRSPCRSGPITRRGAQAARRRPGPRSSPGSRRRGPATTSATSRTRSSARRARRPLDHPHASSATASAATCTRTRRSRTSASPARAPSSRRAWCWRSSRWSTPAAPRSAWATTAGPSTPSDGSLAAHFEFTVAVTADGPRILTPWHE